MESISPEMEVAPDHREEETETPALKEEKVVDDNDVESLVEETPVQQKPDSADELSTRETPEETTDTETLIENADNPYGSATTNKSMEDGVATPAPDAPVGAERTTILEPPAQKDTLYAVSRPKPSSEPTVAPDILSLPHDSLHSIASFLTPLELCELGLASRGAHRVCRDIFRNVRMHGFRCAQEMVTSWKLGEHEDARELAALYISSGVPVYPRCLGHSYHTLVWRMGVEAKQMNAALEESPSTEDLRRDESVPTVDPFYSNRIDFRARAGYNPDVTYLEEKALFWLEEKANDLVEAGGSAAAYNRVRRAPSPTGERLGNTEGRVYAGNPCLGTTQEGASGSKIPLSIHQHLLDQHARGRYFVDDQDGGMVTPLISLSADFYHPTPSSPVRLPELPGDEIWPPNRSTVPDEVLGLSSPSSRMEGTEADLGAQVFPNDRIESEPMVADNVAAAFGPLDNQDDILFEPPQPMNAQRIRSVRDKVDLEVYAASSTAAPKSEEVEDSKELKRHMRSRFAVYERRLETFLAQGDNTGFEECVVDFWDEFFPQTAYIMYHDRNTAVPRVSCLQKFLTRPCPKALGIVQCEIERIKIVSKGKGVNMKGRLFPTYEYRLFIRNVQHTSSPESAASEPEEFVRRDTVLMVAKNRGRKHAEASGVVPMTAVSKKGSNNYYLYMPQQSDVDAHYNKVNELERPGRFIPNGACHDPVLMSQEASSVLLGRLQSNFIGTEFQIFTPRLRKRPRHNADPQAKIYSPSDEELDYDSGMSSDNTASRRSRFSRLSLRRNNNAGMVADAATDAMCDLSTRSTRGQTVKRTVSCPDIQTARHGRTNRRAIANTPDTQEPRFYEEEDGAITYTANLLGSRPRIMDVCLPRVRVDRDPGAEWKRYLETCDDTDDCRMLTCFRQLLQRLDAQDLNGADATQNDNESEDTAGAAELQDYGLISLQNRPPWWNIELGSFVLNFGGRVSVASVKNFQLCDRLDQDRIMLQFGRIHGRHSFTMDFQHPLTAVQAFSIAISSLQSKISFG